MSIASRARQDMAYKSKWDAHHTKGRVPKAPKTVKKTPTLAEIDRKTGTRSPKHTKPHGRRIKVVGCNEKVVAR